MPLTSSSPSDSPSKDEPNLLEDLLGGGDASRRAHADHAGGDIDGVAPDIELIALLTDDAGNDRTGMNADPDLPAEMGIDQGRGHLQPAANRRADRIVDLAEQSGHGHEAVANGLDLFEPVLGGDALENDEERIEPRHHVLGFVLVAIGGEVGHVAEQDRDILVTPRNHRADAADLVGGYLRQQRVEQLVGLVARVPRLD